jgi:hypothetical protein
LEFDYAGVIFPVLTFGFAIFVWEESGFSFHTICFVLFCFFLGEVFFHFLTLHRPGLSRSRMLAPRYFLLLKLAKGKCRVEIFVIAFSRE